MNDESSNSSSLGLRAEGRRHRVPSSRSLFHLGLAACLLFASTACAAAAKDTDRDRIPDSVEKKVGSPVRVKQKFVLVATSPNRRDTAEQAKRNAPDIIRFQACHVAEQRMLFKVTFARKPNLVGAHFIIYADMDNNPATGRKDTSHQGVDVMLVLSGDNLTMAHRNRAYTKHNTWSSCALHDRVLYIGLDAPLAPKGGTIPIGLHLLSQRRGGKGDAIRHKVVTLPFHAGLKAPKVARGAAPGLRALSDYRYHNDRVKLEKLKDKGLTWKQVRPPAPMRPGRQRPKAPFAAKPRKPGKAGSIKRRKIAVHLQEEADVRRSRTPITFGFPLPEGAVFDLKHLRVLSPGRREVPAQFTATAFWPDDSLKWVLVDFTAALARKGKAVYSIEVGALVRRADASSRLRVDETAEAVTVVTGPLKAVIGKRRFNVFRGIWLDKNGDALFSQEERVAAYVSEGIRLVDEKGKRLNTSARKPASIVIEEQGPQKVVIRVAGKYAAPGGSSYMDYIVRLIFRAGSPRVTVHHTQIDTYLKTEFADITSLTMPLELDGGLTHATAFVPRPNGSLAKRDSPLAGGRPFKIFQSDERTFSLRSGTSISGGKRYSGVVQVEGPRAKVGVVIHEMWQRWPKAFEANPRELVVGILPKQPSRLYGRQMPHYLQFPLCEGKYRFKWGISFSTRVTFDFSGTIKPAELAADADHPSVAVLPAAWYAETMALGRVPVPFGKQFAQWDQFVETCYKGHMANKQRAREYGYFNYGDWYGERGRNWGNNEYDTAHSFFMQFARTGNRDYFRHALAAARHQADTDCVHAYPDPFYVGANHEHSIGHTGTWSQHPKHATWSYGYSGGTWAANGHTWAKGMMEAWHLHGEARVMEACIGLGEHIAWAMAPNFHRLGSHERSAGWSLIAIMAIYNGTLDPVYLKAAKSIAKVALREQKFDEGGAWPHRLPLGHSRENPGARGNNVFLIGVLLNGLMEYHQVTRDPAVAKSILAGARWQLKSWNAHEASWPYSAGWDAKPLYSKVATGVNSLIVAGVAYAGKLSGEERFFQVAEAGLGRALRSHAGSNGKSIAMQMTFTPDTLALLQEWHAAHRPDKGANVLAGSAMDTERFVAGTREARSHDVRAPDEKVFWLKLTGTTAELTAKRAPFGGMHKRSEFGTIAVHDAAGKVVQKGKYSTDLKYAFRATLKSARRGGVYKVIVTDDQRAIWALSGESMKIVMQTVKGFRIGGVGRHKYCFLVPRGTREFSVSLLGVHSGSYGGAVLSPANKMVAHHQGANTGRALIKGVARPGEPVASKRGLLKVKPPLGDTGKVWSLALWAAGDIGCELTGVPPYLGLKEKDVFVPE